MGLKYKIEFDTKWVPAYVKDLEGFADMIITRVLEEQIDPATQWMKDNASWQDRTGAARQALHAWVHGYALFMGHGRNILYAKYLEANPKFAILPDAADFFYQVIKRRLARVAKGFR